MLYENYSTVGVRMYSSEQLHDQVWEKEPSDMATGFSPMTAWSSEGMHSVINAIECAQQTQQEAALLAGNDLRELGAPNPGLSFP